MKRNKLKLLSLLLIFTFLMMPLQPVAAQSLTDTDVTGTDIAAVTDFDFNIIEEDDNHLVMEVSTSKDIKIVIDYQLNVDKKEGILNLSNYIGDNLLGKQDPIVISTDEKKIDAEQFIAAFSQTTSNLANRISDNESAQIKAIPLIGVLFASYSSAALSALYSYLVANWSAIAVAGIATAGVYNADDLFDYLENYLFNHYIEYWRSRTAGNHMSGATVDNIVRRDNSPTKIYYGPSMLDDKLPAAETSNYFSVILTI